MKLNFSIPTKNVQSSNTQNRFIKKGKTKVFSLVKLLWPKHRIFFRSKIFDPNPKKLFLEDIGLLSCYFQVPM